MIVSSHGLRLTAVPPLLQLRRQAHRKERQERGRRARARLEQLNGIGRAAPGSKIWNKAATHPTPTRLFAAPSQATTGPGQLLTIKQTTTGSNHPKAVLSAWTGMHRSVLQQCLYIRTQGRNRCHRDDQALRAVITLKSHPEGWQNDRSDGRPQLEAAELNTALLQREF